MAWHPTHPSTLAVGSKGGDIMLWNFGIKDKPTFIKGVSSSDNGAEEVLKECKVIQ